MNQHHMMPHITVESPVTHNSWEDGKYTTYDIVVNVSVSYVFLES